MHPNRHLLVECTCHLLRYLYNLLNRNDKYIPIQIIFRCIRNQEGSICDESLLIIDYRCLLVVFESEITHRDMEYRSTRRKMFY